MKVSVYVDGFNLYFRALRKHREPDGSSHRWLDIGKLAAALLTSHSVERIRYFTARVKSRPENPDSPARQHAYLRALRTIPNVTIHEGRFLQKPKWMKLITPLADGTDMVRVRKTEEKGSDVNLASYLLLDGFQGKYEAAAVITNDSDLVEPIRMVRDELKLPVTVLDPCIDTGDSLSLKNVATFYRKIRRGAIAASLFPETLRDARGVIKKPSVW